MTTTPDLLEAIVAATRTRVAAAIEREPHASVERRAMSRSTHAADFTVRLARSGSINIIAECKRRSPSRGVLRAAYLPYESHEQIEKATRQLPCGEAEGVLAWAGGAGLAGVVMLGPSLLGLGGTAGPVVLTHVDSLAED